MNEHPCITTYRTLCAARAPWEPWWETLRHYVMPSRLEEGREVPDADGRSLSDTTAVEA